MILYEREENDFGLRREFWADFLPYTLSSLFPSVLFTITLPLTFSPFISPKIVYYAPISVVYLACSHLHVLPFPLLSSITALPVVFSHPSFLFSSTFILSSVLSLPLSSPLLLYRNSRHSSRLRPCPRLSATGEWVHVGHRVWHSGKHLCISNTKLWISTPLFIPLISVPPSPNSLLAVA